MLEKVRTLSDLDAFQMGGRGELTMMNRAEALRKCIVVFDALRRVSSKGNAGLEPMEGAEDSFQTDSEILFVLREWLQEMESGANLPMNSKELEEEKGPRLRDWQEEVMKNGPQPLILKEDAVNVELEGSGATWWYVCSECRREVSLMEKECPSCRKRLKWENVRPV
jgi:hypothetical protein